MLQLPNALSAQDFLDEYWQKTPLELPAALSSKLPKLTDSNIAWLATLDDVESRLVITDRTSPKVTYQVETGPFSDSELSALPERDWTLLVYDVEKHLADFRAWFAEIQFVADWRIDDLMVSLAAPGGNVGPHQDNYDVFLCQQDGIRDWQVGTTGGAASHAQGGHLALLESFTAGSTISAMHNDVLYLPPGTPHWGVAREKCTTYSIGMRAPQQNELGRCYAAAGVGGDNPFTETEASSAGFYADPDLQISESCGSQISTQAINRCRQLTRSETTCRNADLAIAMGCAVTELKAWLVPEMLNSQQVLAALHALKANEYFAIHAMSRFASWQDGRQAFTFVNGQHRSIKYRNLQRLEDLFESRRLTPDMLSEAATDADLQWALSVGLFDLFSPQPLR